MRNLAAYFRVLLTLRLTYTHSPNHPFVCHFNAFYAPFHSLLHSVYGTLPNPIRSTNSAYRNHPGKIEDFTPGHSSATDKERREVCMCVCVCFQEFSCLPITIIMIIKYIIGEIKGFFSILVHHVEFEWRYSSSDSK